MNGKLIPVVLLVTLVACKKPMVQEQGPRPVKVTEVTALNVVEKSFSGIVAPDQFSDLAFKMSGPLVSLNVDAGQKVKTGQVIAEIDPQDFKWDYEAKKASYQTAQAQLQRAEKLLSKQAISRQEYETSQAAYSNAKAAYENSLNTYEQTKLRAPFDGFIAKKYVENYQKVQTGQAIVSLINPKKLLIQFTMPENNVIYLTDSHKLFVEFDTYKGVYFKTKIKDYVEASPDGTGVPVWLYIDDPKFDLDKYKVAVGFSCRVILKAENEEFMAANLIPLSAIVSPDDSKEKGVFVVKGDQVEYRPIKEDGLVGTDGVIVSSGVAAGEKVVSAGATRLVNGQQVKILTD
ncbi:efflux RND transporter periplasmic adaptor subunit [Parabacteroides pacaensis]|uniref:efflux RND transporter periplasmic adaptor subunit n=1 Tax=Parabacteroides pacaensis TaxID=2086575 RepID=UPI000D0FEBA7|nr:efflux RND transporter periplasmic adaptor subunit [Parabacteroides pacaensis]